MENDVIEFIMNEYKDNKQRYNDFSDYCDGIIVELVNKVHLSKKHINIHNYDRIGNMRYQCFDDNKCYNIQISENTYDSFVQLYIIIEAEKVQSYDERLENIKVELKNLLHKEWKECIWIRDEQSEMLATELYGIVSKTENEMRSFVNQVMYRRLGYNWVERNGLEKINNRLHDKKYRNEYNRLSPQFENINITLLSLTIGELECLLFADKIYKKELCFDDKDYIKIHKALSESDDNSIIEKIRESRVLEYDIGKDIFSQYFDDDYEDVHKKVETFRKNRNHIAHNKLIDKSTYDIIKEDTEALYELFVDAEKKFKENDLPDEEVETRRIIEETHREEQQVIYDCIKADTGIDIYDENGILRVFNDRLSNFYSELEDVVYFNHAVCLGDYLPLKNISQKQHIFTVNSNVDDKYSIHVYAELEISSGNGSESTCDIVVESSKSDVLFETKVTYQNGEARMGEYGIYEPVLQNELKDQSIDELMKDIKYYINNEMNPVIKELETADYELVKDGCLSVIADIPCYNCGEYYISLDESIYPFGHCAFCGEDNEINTCERCEGNFHSWDMHGKLCENCYERIMRD